jgi:hypothetical protein
VQQRGQTQFAALRMVASRRDLLTLRPLDHAVYRFNLPPLSIVFSGVNRPPHQPSIVSAWRLARRPAYLRRDRRQYAMLISGVRVIRLAVVAGVGKQVMHADARNKSVKQRSKFVDVRPRASRREHREDQMCLRIAGDRELWKAPIGRRLPYIFHA